MKIHCVRMLGPDRDRFMCTIGSKTVTVVLRSADSFPDALNVDDIESDGGIHVAMIDKPRKADKQVGEPFAEAKSGDLVILLYTGRESRKATLDVLGLDDTATVFDRQ